MFPVMAALGRVPWGGVLPEVLLKITGHVHRLPRRAPGLGVPTPGACGTDPSSERVAFLS